MTATDAPLYDPFSWDLHDDPYPTYRILRDEHPVFFNEERKLWALTQVVDPPPTRVHSGNQRGFTSLHVRA